jgi:Tfp pilus assembly protein PilF
VTLSLPLARGSVANNIVGDIKAVTSEEKAMKRAMRRGRSRKHSAAGGSRRRAVLTLVVLLLLASVVLFASACSNPLSEAQKAEQAGDLSSAATLYQERLKTRPDDLTAIKALADIFYMQRKWDEALPYQEKAIALDPKEAQIRVELGFNYLNHQSKPAEAVRVLQEAAALEPTAKYLAFLAQAQLAVGDDQGAEKTLRTALAADKSYPHTYTLLVQLLERQGRAAEATELRSAAEAAGAALQTAETAK